jgi:FMN phosphatase YigB (HAD superfamily)
MNIFLDFDRVIFNTDRYYTEIIATHPDLKEEAAYIAQFKSQSPERLVFFDRIARGLEDGSLIFDTHAMPQYMFPDAETFIQKYGANITVITFGPGVYQRFKVEHTLVHIPFKRVIYTEYQRKGAMLEEECSAPDFSGIFVDDSPKELISVARACPGLCVIEMRRDNNEPVGDYPVARSFEEVEAFL